MGGGSADLMLARRLVNDNEADKIRHAWLGELFDVRNNLVVRQCSDGVAGVPMLPLGDINKYCAIAWPLRQVQVDVRGEQRFFFELAMAKNPRALFWAVVDQADWEAVPIQWTSPTRRCRK